MTNKNLNFIKELVRKNDHTKKIPTEITFEESHNDNPFHTENMYIHGYEHFDLMNNTSFSEMIFLLFRGELPNKEEKVLFEKLLGSLINLGVRNPATRAAMTLAIGRSNPLHILPASLSIASGNYIGGEDVMKSMIFLAKNVDKDISEVVNSVLKNTNYDKVNNPLIVSGFGSVYGGCDPYTQKLVNYITQYNINGKYFNFSKKLVNEFNKHEASWLLSGFAAAVLLDLGFKPKEGGNIYLIAVSACLGAHGLEKSAKPVTDMPFVSDEDYHISEEALCNNSMENKNEK